MSLAITPEHIQTLSAPAAPAQVRIVAGFSALAPGAWEPLWQADPAAHPYNSAPWLAAWERHFAPGAVRVLLAESAGRLIGALPVWVCRRWRTGRFRGRLLTLAGSCSSAYPLDMGPLLDPAHRDAALDALARALARQRGADAILCELYAAGSATHELLQRVSALTRSPLQQHEVEQSHLVNLAPTYEAFLESLGSRTRRNVRAYAKKFYEAGPQHAVAAAQTPEQFRALMAAMAEQKARRFADLGKQSNFDEARLTAFLNEALPALHAAGLLTGLMAQVGEKIAATQLYLHDPHGHAYSYNSSFDPDYKELRLHYILETERFKRAIEAGYAQMDLSTGHAEHKEHWTGGLSRSLYEGAIFLNWRGRAVNKTFDLLRAWKQRRAAKAAAAAAPPPPTPEASSGTPQ